MIDSAGIRVATFRLPVSSTAAVGVFRRNFLPLSIKTVPSSRSKKTVGRAKPTWAWQSGEKFKERKAKYNRNANRQNALWKIRFGASSVLQSFGHHVAPVCPIMSETEDSSAIIPEAIEQETSNAVNKIRAIYTNLGLPEGSPEDAVTAVPLEKSTEPTALD